MKVWQGLLFGMALAMPAMPALWPINDARGAARVSGHASTVIEWFDDAEEDTIVPGFQYLQLNVLDIADKGYDFRFYGRAGHDLADRRSSYAKSRLYHAYLEKQGFLYDALDFRLGRQFITTPAGASVMDGLRVDYGFLDNYRLTLFGGGDVTYYEGYNAKDAIGGGEIAGRFLDRNLHLGLSYLTRWDGGHQAQELFGLNAELDLKNAFYIYNDTQYDRLSDRVSYFLIGAKYHESPLWSARAEYLYSLPVFFATSIYSVFAVEEYQEVLTELTYNILPGYRAFGRYVREIYQEFDDADVFEAGIEKLRTDRVSGYLSGVYRNDDDGQDLKGFKARVSYLWPRYIETGVGVQIDVLERRLAFDSDQPDDDTTSRRYWADMTLVLNREANLQAKVERIESDLWDYYHRGRVRLNIFF